jgi:hypothetical protein
VFDEVVVSVCLIQLDLSLVEPLITVVDVLLVVEAAAVPLVAIGK